MGEPRELYTVNDTVNVIGRRESVKSQSILYTTDRVKNFEHALIIKLILANLPNLVYCQNKLLLKF